MATRTISKRASMSRYISRAPTVEGLGVGRDAFGHGLNLRPELFGCHTEVTDPRVEDVDLAHVDEAIALAEKEMMAC